MKDGGSEKGAWYRGDKTMTEGECIIQLLERWRDHCERLAKSEIIPNTNERILHEAACADHAVRIARGAMRTLRKKTEP